MDRQGRDLWTLTLQEASAGSEALAIGLFECDGTVTAANAGMRKLLRLDEGGTPPARFQTPRFDTLVASPARDDVVFEGLLTLGDDDEVGITLRARVTRHGERLLVIGEHDVAEQLRLGRALTMLNQEVNDLQRDLIKDKRKLERTLLDLQDANRRLREVNEQKDRFLGIAAHDLRNPLGTTSGYAKLLLSDLQLDASATRNALQAIERAASKMLRLVDDLLDIAKIESGTVDLALEEVNLPTYVASILTLNRPVGASKGIALVAELPPDDAQWRFDPARIEQVLDNLIGNAFKFSYPDSVVRLAARVVDGVLEFSVADEGQGIPASEVDGIFGEFSQTSTRATGGEKGAGLGLAICRRIVHLHGGTIAVESEPGAGSRFYIRLPARRSE